MDRRQHCRDLLIGLCPEMFRPMAEMMIPLVLPEMEEDQLILIEKGLEEATAEPDEMKKAQMLLDFVHKNGGSIDFEIIPPEIRSMLPVG